MARPKFSAFRVASKAFHELIIMPLFGDVTDEVTGDIMPSDEEGDWMVMDNVGYQRPIMELFGGQNVLKRRDATCKLIYSPVGRLGARYIRTEALYAATEDCQEEFYQGCFIDYENEDWRRFFENAMPILQNAVSTDIWSNKWFGDLTRPADPDGIWSWNKFNGIFYHLAQYVASGVIDSSKTFDIPAGDLLAQDAHDYLQQAYGAQDYVFKKFSARDKCFYVDQDIADAYWDWLVLAGQSTVQERQSGVATQRFRGIEVKVKAWDGLLTALNGGVAAHCIILTVRGNFIYAADSNYGGGRNRNEAVRIWWSEDDGVWRRNIFLKAGTEIAAPQFLVLGLTSF